MQTRTTLRAVTVLAVSPLLGSLAMFGWLAETVAQDKKTAAPTLAAAADASDRTKLPIPDPEFKGKIGKTYKESEPAWPKIPTAAKDAPNIVVILLDDVGFGQTSTFGGLIPTPNLDKLAFGGLRYNRFHTTALCSSRSSSPAPSSRYGSI